MVSVTRSTASIIADYKSVDVEGKAGLADEGVVVSGFCSVQGDGMVVR